MGNVDAAARPERRVRGLGGWSSPATCATIREGPRLPPTAAPIPRETGRVLAVGDIVVIGGSSGALEGLRTLVAGLPKDLAASLFVVIHTAPDAPGFLDRILGRASRLPVRYAVDGEPIELGHIYLAPPDRHLLLRQDVLRVTRGPRENRFRPAIDPLFRTAATEFHGAIGIILSGGQDDGAAGLAMIKRSGGIAMVQDPAEALQSSMPEAALRHVAADYVLSAKDMPAVLAGLVRERLAQRKPTMKAKPRRDVAEAGAHDIHHADRLGPPSPFTCPDCGGTLWQSQDGDLVQFQCHVGHRYSGDSLSSAQADALDTALWSALRALEESAELRRRMARHAEDRGMPLIADSYHEQAIESEQRAATIRRLLMPESREHDTRTDPVPALQPDRGD